jgi:polyadenylate-binding protein
MTSAGNGPVPASPMSAQPGFPSASLYVGDLNPEVTEALLFDIFNAVGPVASIRVCRDAVTRRSLGYAYVNFHNVTDAERALDTMNFTSIHGRPCRIMWSQRDPMLRKSGLGNIFVKNLDRSIDNKQLYDTFSVFGNILSCKVAQDEHGNSLGYGFVHYELEEAAKKAIEKVNGMKIQQKIVTVQPFRPKAERGGGDKATFTNVYVKNLPEDFTKEKLNELFAPFGDITSSMVAIENGKAKGFGFVNFEQPEAAAAAVAELHEKKELVEGRPLCVARAQKRAERNRELQEKFEKLRLERAKKFQGVNLYIKNLADDVDDAKLREEFSRFGQITSARVMVDQQSGRSRGFGFVCFTSPDEATKAVTEMNGKLAWGKPLYVALAQRKEVRRAQLEAHSRTKLATPGGMPSYMGAMPGFPYGPGVPAMPMNPVAAQRAGQFPYPNPGNNWRAPQMGQMPAGPQGRWPVGAMPMPMGAGRGNAPMGYPAGRPEESGEAAAAPANAAGFDNVNVAQLVDLSTQKEQLETIGANIYPLIAQSQPELAPKITGMLLDSLEIQELLHLMESPEALTDKIQEALQVLKEHELAQDMNQQAAQDE